MIAALFVARNGCYFGLPDVDPWDEARDARLYVGPYPVVAHPPCERWGRYWHGGPSCKIRKVKGADGGCFEAALSAVRKWGGVLEHPADSAAWAHFGMNKPPRSGGWIVADFFGGWTCCVEQGAYGHKARKATWLYASRLPRLPSLKWGPAAGTFTRLDEGFHSSAERRAARDKIKQPPRSRLSTAENLATPLPFRDLLLDLARSAAP